MAFIPFDFTAKVAMVFTNRNQQFVNTYHCITGEAIGETELEELCVIFRTWWADELKDTTATDVFLQRIEAVSLESQNAPGFVYTAGLPLPGNGAAIAMPGNVTFVVSWLTNSRGRSYRGRTYHVGLQYSQVEGSSLGGTAINSFTAAYQALLPALVAGGWNLVIASRYSNHVARTLGVTTQVNAVVIDGNLDSQRRRLPGRGI